LRKSCLFPVVVFVALITLWEAATHFFRIQEFLLPAPSSIVAAFSTSLLPHFPITLYEAVAGFVLAVIVSLMISIVFYYSKILEISFYPYVVMVKMFPIMALTPFLIMWFGNGMASKIIAAAIISIFPLVVNISRGFKEIDQDFEDVLGAFQRRNGKFS